MDSFFHSKHAQETQSNPTTLLILKRELPGPEPHANPIYNAMSEKNTQYHGVNSQGNTYNTAGGTNSNVGSSYHYSNNDGSYYYKNDNGSTYYNNGGGYSRYTDASGNVHAKQSK